MTLIFNRATKVKYLVPGCDGNGSQSAARVCGANVLQNLLGSVLALCNHGGNSLGRLVNLLLLLHLPVMLLCNAVEVVLCLSFLFLVLLVKVCVWLGCRLGDGCCEGLCQLSFLVTCTCY